MGRLTPTNIDMLIPYVRLQLGNVPEDWLSNDQIRIALERADDFCDEALLDDLDVDTYQDAVIRLAAYFSYVEYINVVERDLGNVPSLSALKVGLLAQNALIKLRRYSKYIITDTFELIKTPVITNLPRLDVG